MTLVGRTALSVEMKTRCSTPHFGSQFDHVARAEDVVGDRLGNVALHHRHVLVRGGMEDGHRFEPLEDPGQAVPIADIGDHRD